MDINHVISALIKALEGLDSNLHLNERYPHHLFSHMVQKVYPVSVQNTYGLHPEWATAINGKRHGGRYKRVGYEYWPTSSGGSAGFIDFAIGDAENPECAIEFKMAKKLDKEGVIFDYMKLMDGRNSFSNAISVVVYYGHKIHSPLCDPEVLYNCLSEAKKRLCKDFIDRPHQFHVVEVINGKFYCHLLCEKGLVFVNQLKQKV